MLHYPSKEQGSVHNHAMSCAFFLRVTHRLGVNALVLHNVNMFAVLIMYCVQKGDGLKTFQEFCWYVIDGEGMSMDWTAWIFPHLTYSISKVEQKQGK